MAPETRSMTAVGKKWPSFTDDSNPFSPLVSQLSSHPRSPTCTRSPSPPQSPALISSLSTLPSNFNTISSRINSYANWPHQHLSPTKLAAAGFFHQTSDDHKDLVECAFCDVWSHSWVDEDLPIEDLMLDHEDDCLWPKLRADFYNHLPLLAPPNTATPRTPNKTLTLTISPTPKKQLPSRIPRPSPKRKPLSLQLPQSNPQPPAHSPPPALLPPSSPQPHTYASILASPPLKQPTPSRQKPPSPVLTVQDLITRFRNKPAPFKQPRPPRSRPQPPTPQ